MITEIDEFFLNIQDKPGLYGLYSVRESGKSVLIMYISHLLAKRGKRGILDISLELTEEMWKNRMISMGLGVEGIKIVDTAYSLSDIEKLIEEYTPSIVFIHYLKLIDDSEVISRLKEIAEKKSVAIVVAAHLGRNCGDGDPVYRRPRLFDLVWVYDREKTIAEFLNDMRSYTAILFLHRNHDCDRGIGSAYRYNFCNMAEITVYEAFSFKPPFSMYFDFGRIINTKDDSDSC